MSTRRRIKKIDIHKFIAIGKQPGTVPGTVTYVGTPREEAIQIKVLTYDETRITEKKLSSIEGMEEILRETGTKWIQIIGIHDSEVINQIGTTLGVFSLDLEDIANTTQRPRIEERDNYLMMVFKVLLISQESNEVNQEQMTILLGDGYVVSFHETDPHIFEPLRSRLLASKGRVRKMKGDYLVFAICDILIDQYFALIENIGEMVEDTEENLLNDPDRRCQEMIYRLKRRLGYVMKTIWPTREVFSRLQQSDHPLIYESSKVYYRNIYDHTVQIIESLESLHELVSGMMDLYLSSVSNRMNEIMKVLTIFSAIFIPMTFIAGVYGMNFKDIPEIEWPHGYWIFWGVMISITLIMLSWFKRRKWL